jgi:hypothetical protein
VKLLDIIITALDSFGPTPIEKAQAVHEVSKSCYSNFLKDQCIIISIEIDPATPFATCIVTQFSRAV